MSDSTNGESITERLNNFLNPTEPAPVQESEPMQVQEEQAPVEMQEPEIDEGAENDGEALELTTLAQYIGLDPERLDYEDGQLYVKTKIDGEEGKAKLTDLVKSYQLEGHLNKKSIELSDKQKALDAKFAEAEKIANQKITQLEDLSKLAYSKLVSDYNKVNWQELRELDPTEFLIKQKEFEVAQKDIQSAFNQVQHERQQQELKRQNDYQQYLAKEAEKLLEKIPEWKNPETAKKEREEFRQYARSNGFTDDEISSIGDHRVATLFRKAMLFDKFQSDKTTLEKKVVTAPKLVKPGHSNKPSAAQGLNKLRNTIKETGGKAGVADYLMRKGIV